VRIADQEARTTRLPFAITESEPNVRHRRHIPLRLSFAVEERGKTHFQVETAIVSDENPS
jgi:hypothetical protein